MNYTEVWEKHGAELKAALDAAERIVRGWEVPPNAVFTRNHGDLPELNVRWMQGDGISRTLQIIFDTPDAPEPSRESTLAAAIEGGAWVDVDSPPSIGRSGKRERWWRSASFAGRVPLFSYRQPDHSEDKRYRLVPITPGWERIREALAEVSRWTVEDLNKRTALPENLHVSLGIGPINEVT